MAFEWKRPIEEIMEMEIWKFRQVLRELEKYYKAQEKAMKGRATIRGPKTLR